MRPQGVRDLASIEATARDPAPRILGRARYQFSRARKVVGRAHSGTERRYDRKIDSLIEMLQFGDELPSDQQRQSMNRVGYGADRRVLRAAGESPGQASETGLADV